MCQKIFRPKKISPQNIFWTQHFFYPKNLLNENFFRPIFFEAKYFFTQNFLRFFSVIEILCRSWSGFGPVSDIIGPVLLCYFSQTTTFHLPCLTQLKPRINLTPKPSWVQYHHHLFTHLYPIPYTTKGVKTTDQSTYKNITMVWSGIGPELVS